MKMGGSGVWMGEGEQGKRGKGAEGPRMKGAEGPRMEGAEGPRMTGCSSWEESFGGQPRREGFGS